MKGHCDKSDAGCEGKGHCEGKMDCKGEEGCPEMGSCCMMMMHGGACPMMMEGHPGCGEGAGMIGGHGDSVMKNIEVKVTVNGDSAMKGNPHGMMMGGGCCCMKMMMMHHSCMKKEGCEGKAEGCGKKESCKGEMHGKKECCDKK
ncbi:MAG: hypothetical protein Fur0041_19070 [Bacteroidia bacterium]